MWNHIMTNVHLCKFLNGRTRCLLDTQGIILRLCHIDLFMFEKLMFIFSQLK